MSKHPFWKYLYDHSAIVLAVGMAAFAAMDAYAGQSMSPKASKKASQLDNFGGLEVAIGSEHAPLTIVMYYSLSCSHCHDFQKDEMPKIQKEFIDKNLVRFIYRDFPTDYSFALKAAKIAWCHGGKQYISFSRKLLENQDKWLPKYPNRGDFKTDQDFKDAEKAAEEAAQKAFYDIAKELGISDADYHKCTAPDTMTEKTILQTSFDAQRTHQIQAAPAFLINGKVYEGALNPETIHTLLLDMGIHG